MYLWSERNTYFPRRSDGNGYTHARTHARTHRPCSVVFSSVYVDLITADRQGTITTVQLTIEDGQTLGIPGQAVLCRPLPLTLPQTGSAPARLQPLPPGARG